MTSRFDRWLAYVLKIVAAVLLLGALFLVWQAYHGSQPDVKLPESRNLARVAILIDGTRSTGAEEDNFADVKQIVRDKVIPNIGLGDTVSCYDVQPTFASKTNLVFSYPLLEEQLPSESDILNTIQKKREKPQVTTSEMYELIRSLAPFYPRLRKSRKSWAQQVDARQTPAQLGSDICNPLLNLADTLRQGEPRAEKWLFILSDLRNETADKTKTCNTKDPLPAETHILWVYPLGLNSPSWENVAAFWKPLFGDLAPTRISFTAAITGDPLLPPGPTAGLERYHLETPWEVACRLLQPTLLTCAVLIALGAGIAALVVHRERPERASGKSAVKEERLAPRETLS